FASLKVHPQLASVSKEFLLHCAAWHSPMNQISHSSEKLKSRLSMMISATYSQYKKYDFIKLGSSGFP
ncbi:hypothetical protein ACLOJK_008214, partial [Asimina triloba]